MADSFTQVAPDSTGDKIDTSEITVGANTVQRQRINIADPVTAANIATVSAAGALKVDNSGINQPSVGNVAHDAVDSGAPIKVGGIARQANPTAVAALDRVDASFDDLGRQVVVLNQVRDLVVQQGTTISTTTETTILTAGAAGVFHDITLLMITNTSATAVRVDIRDATAGTIRFSVAIAANGGAVIPFAVPLVQTTVASNWTATLSGAVTDIRIFVQAVKNN